MVLDSELRNVAICYSVDIFHCVIKKEKEKQNEIFKN